MTLRLLVWWIPRIAAWVLAITLVVLSVVPARLRPGTDAPHDLEHFAAFLITGVAFGFGYWRKPVVITLALVLYSALIEIAQIFLPDRHARVSDFIVDALAASIGAVAASLAAKAAAAKDPTLF